MTPPDGSDFPSLPVAAGAEPGQLTDTLAILLHGGKALLLFQGLDSPPPRAGRLGHGDQDQGWTAECWRIAQGDREEWCGLAVLGALPLAGARLRDEDGGRDWRLATQPRVDIAPQPLADLVRRGGVDSRAIFGFLVRHLLAGHATDSTAARAYQAFATGFFTAAAERDGFIEILATPDGGGLFAQGWSMSLAAGPTMLAGVAHDLAVREVEVALFEREDILPPGHGFCFFGKGWRDEELDAVDAVFFEMNGRLLRLDVVHGAVLQLTGTPATTHVAQMLPRLLAPEATRRAFKRVCRPCFQGADTLSGTPLPVAAAFDALLQAPDGALLAIGWMLDPLRRVERVLIKSTGNLYAPIHDSWCALPRLDLHQGFGTDRRFAGLLDEHDCLHGFIVHAPASRAETDGAELYLEIVLDDDSCLFRPLTATPFESAERLPHLLGALSPRDPELGRVVEEHLAPFLASVRPAAIVPFRAYAELQPILGLLAGTPEAEALDLVLVTSRSVATETLPRLTEAFDFYGLSGGLVFASEHETTAGRLDLGVAATASPTILCLTPAALPKSAGWLAALMAEAESLPTAGLLSPAMTYEDGSIYFGGESADPLTVHGACALSGYGANWLRRGPARPVAAGAPEVALIGRAALEAAGGFSGHLFSDAYTHVDLAARLRRAGHGSYCSGAVEFWMLDDSHAAQPSPFARLMRQVDAALLDRVVTAPRNGVSTV